MNLVKKTMALVLSLIMIITCLPTFAVSAAEVNSNVAVPDDMTMTSFKEQRVAPGITEHYMTTRMKNNNKQVINYAAVIDMNDKNIGVLAGYKNYNSNGKWGMQTVRDQARAAEQATGKNIVVAVNGDFFNMSNGEPENVLVMNGKVLHKSANKAKDTDPCYFGITKDGKPVIRMGTEPLDDLQQAVGSRHLYVKKGVINENLGKEVLRPGAAIGITADNKVVVFSVDGRRAESEGITYYQQAKMMKAYGCVDAMALDGGGSATFCTKSEGTNELTVKNTPSDGPERAVSSSILIYTDAKPSGEFDHASIAPFEDIYTPNSEVQFSAKGVDSAGGKAPLPKDLTYALADASFGTIDAKTGKFVSTGKTGKVVVNAVSGGKVVGTTSIEIQKPDKIDFEYKNINLGYKKESDLGIRVTYKQNPVIYHDGDFEWVISETKDLENKPVDTSALGKFNGNKFFSAATGTAFGKITCTYKGSTVKGELNVAVGIQPKVVMDFEDVKNTDGSVTPAKDYWDFDRAVFHADNGRILQIKDEQGNNVDVNKPKSTLLHGHYTNDPKNPNNSRGGNESAEIVDIASGEPVRIGNYSLKLNYDFSKINGIEGACVGFSQASQQIPGNPTGIGMYVYAPENTPNLWLRLRVRDGNGTVVTLDFTEKMTAAKPGELGGINWTGWKYVEASLEKLQGPFTLIGGETIRVMHTYAAYGGMGNYYEKDGQLIEVPREQCKGSLYFDNVQFVYGANSKDTDNPSVDSILANGKTIEDNTVVDSNNVNFDVNVKDIENDNTSGIDYATANIWLDGFNLTKSKDFSFNEAKGTVSLANQYLVNGTHNVKVLIRDKEGNEAVLAKSFTVNGKDTTAPIVSVGGKEAFAYIGEDYNIDITASDVSKISTSTVTVQLEQGFNNYKVSYGEGYEQAAAPVYNKKDNSVTISAKRKADAKTASKVIAVLSVAIPKNTSATMKFSYYVTSGEYTADFNGEKTLTFATTTSSVGMKSRYNFTNDDIVVGRDAKFYVTTEDGKPAEGISIYKTNGDVLLGTTDKNGVLVTDVFKAKDDNGNPAAEKVSVYAQDKDGKRSFVLETQTYLAGAPSNGTPEFVTINASSDSSTSKNITWISNPDATQQKAVVQVALKSDYDKSKDELSIKNYKGSSKFLIYGGSPLLEENRIVYSNSVEVKNLKPDTEYVYRVGDGKIWSEVYSFNTMFENQDTKFFVMADHQSETTEVLSQILENIKKDKFDFGVQTGDLVENSPFYGEWDNVLSTFDGSLKSTDMIHVTGNHETFGDVNADIQKSMFNIPDRGYYSATYGNVYVAVLGFTESEEKIKEFTNWLVEDSAKSNAKWKVVLSHQSPYGTNETTTDCVLINKYIPAACDKAGIDFMFSGHDHAYVRTNPITAGQRDEENGTVYYLCGTTGQKKYAPTNSKGYDFAIEPTIGYDGIYITVEANEYQFVIKTHDADGTVIDSFTKTKYGCANNLHNYLYRDDENGKFLICADCSHAKRVEDYTGFVHDYSSKLAMSLVNGVSEKNKWIVNDVDNYYVGENGLAVTGTVDIDGKKYTFDKNGVFVKGSFVREKIKLSDNKERTITRYYTAGGKYAINWEEIDGNLYYFKKFTNNIEPDDGAMFFGGEREIRTPGNGSRRYYVFDDNGVLVRGAFDSDTTGTRYYWGENYVTTPQTVDGVNYNFDPETGYMLTKDISTCDVALSFESADYTGSAITPEVTVKDGDSTLLNRYQYYNYSVEYKNNVEPGTATVTIKGNPLLGYTGTKDVTFVINDVVNPDPNPNPNPDPDPNPNPNPDPNPNPNPDPNPNPNPDPTPTPDPKPDPTPTPDPKPVVDPVNVANLTYSAIKTQAYTGKPVCPTIKAYYGSNVLVENVDYVVTYANNVKFGTASATVTGIGNFVGTKTFTFGIVPNKVSGLKAAPVNTSKIKLSWKAMKGVKGYKVYRSTSKNGKYKCVADLKSYKKTSFVDSKRTANKKYYYKVYAYYTSAGKKKAGFASKVVSAKATPAKITVSSVKNVKGKKAKITWKKNSYVSGYIVYRSTSKNGKYKKVGAVKGSNKTSFTDSKLKKNKTYYYKVVAYKTVKVKSSKSKKTKSKNIYGPSSTVKSVKIKK